MILKLLYLGYLLHEWAGAFVSFVSFLAEVGLVAIVVETTIFFYKRHATNASERVAFVIVGTILIAVIMAVIDSSATKDILSLDWCIEAALTTLVLLPFLYLLKHKLQRD